MIQIILYAHHVCVINYPGILKKEYFIDNARSLPSITLMKRSAIAVGCLNYSFRCTPF